VPDLIAPPFFLAAGLLVASGGAKVWRPESASQALAAVRLPSGPWVVRGLGSAELVAGTWALAGPNGWSSLAVAGLYLGFAAFLGALIATGAAVGCGCAGTRDAPPSRVHIGLNLLAVASALVVAASHGIPSAPSFFAGQPLAGIPLVVGVVGLGAVLRAIASDVPGWWRELRRSSSVGHRHGHHDHAPAPATLLQISSGRSEG